MSPRVSPHLGSYICPGVSRGTLAKWPPLIWHQGPTAGQVPFPTPEANWSETLTCFDTVRTSSVLQSRLDTSPGSDPGLNGSGSRTWKSVYTGLDPGRGSLFTLVWIRTWKSVYTGLDPDVEVCLHWTGSGRGSLFTLDWIHSGSADVQRISLPTTDDKVTLDPVDRVGI